MKFCERFHLTPFEYSALPTRKVELWTMMAIIEDGIESRKAKSKGVNQ